MFRKDKKQTMTKDQESARKIEIIDDALLESVSGGRDEDKLPLCIGSHFCALHFGPFDGDEINKP